MKRQKRVTNLELANVELKAQIHGQRFLSVCYVLELNTT